MPSLHVFRTNNTTGKKMHLAQQSEARARAGRQKKKDSPFSGDQSICLATTFSKHF
jgi:hypothetical protein